MNLDLTYPERCAIADSIRSHRDVVAEQVSHEFLQRHPDWVERYGETARVRGVEDARFHIDFLAGAIQSGSAGAFADYASWTAGVLRSRGIGQDFLLENLEQVDNHLGAALAGAEQAISSRFIDAGCTAVRGGAERPGTAPGDTLATERSLYLQAILGGQRQAALNVTLEMVRQGCPVQDIYCDVLQPVQYEIGRLWERNEITVAREHMATAITQYVVAQLYSHFKLPEEKRGTAIVTGVEGELHQLGANMVADVLEAEGWNVRFLGTHMPHRDILHAIEEHEPTVVGVSATMLFNLPKVGRLIEDMRGSFGSDLHVIVGGGAFRGSPEVWREIGADGFGRDLRESVALVEALSPGPASPAEV